jgi:hypothetical protein
MTLPYTQALTLDRILSQMKPELLSSFYVKSISILPSNSRLDLSSWRPRSSVMLCHVHWYLTTLRRIILPSVYSWIYSPWRRSQQIPPKRCVTIYPSIKRTRNKTLKYSRTVLQLTKISQLWSRVLYPVFPSQSCHNEVWLSRVSRCILDVNKGNTTSILGKPSLNHLQTHR